MLNDIFGLNSNHYYSHSETESPIESTLLNHLVKFLHKDTKIFLQEEMSIIGGDFRPDILLVRENYRVIIECDGRDYHGSNQQVIYDDWRDSLLMTQNKCDTVYRIKGVDIHYNIYDVIRILYYFDQFILNSDYCEQISKKEIDDWGITKRIKYPFSHPFQMDYEYDPTYDYSVEIDYQDVEVIRKDLFNDFENYWLKYLIYSLLYPNRNIKYLIKIMHTENLEIKTLIEKLNKNYKNLKIKDEKELLERYRKKNPRKSFI